MVNLYGLSLASAENCEVPSLEGNPMLSYLELPGRAFEKKLPHKLLRQIVNIVDIIPSSIASGIIEQDNRIIQDFRLRISELISKMNSKGIYSFTMDNGIEAVPRDQEHAEKLLPFIKSIAPILYDKKTFMNMPVRIPETVKGAAEKYLNFKTGLMSPCIRFAVNIYPHDLKRDYSPDELLRFFRFDLGTVRIVYEPEIGNRLVEKHVAPWIDYLNKNHYKGPILFCPRLSSEETLIEEIEFLSEFLAKI